MAELELAIPRERSDSLALSLGMSFFFRCGVGEELPSAFSYASNGRACGNWLLFCLLFSAWNTAQSVEHGNALVIQGESEHPGSQGCTWR